MLVEILMKMYKLLVHTSIHRKCIIAYMQHSWPYELGIYAVFNTLYGSIYAEFNSYKLNIIAKNHSKYLTSGLANGPNVCPALFMALYVFKMSLKSIFNLVSAAGDMLAGAQSQNSFPRHVKSIKLTTIT